MKYHRNIAGYGLIECILALALVCCMSALFVPVVKVLQKKPSTTLVYELRGLQQLQTLYATSYQIEWEEDRICFDQGEQVLCLECVNERLILTPGWQVIWDHVQQFHVTRRDACWYLQISREGVWYETVFVCS
ncbi:MAG: hypothetical protein ACRCZJ_09690 [Erysipelotrichaceae bacterium]